MQGEMCVHKQVKSRTLQVEEYVLPKFDVKIDSSEHFNVKDDKVRAIIRSKYTYGKLVKGRAVVTVKPTSYLAWSTRRETDTIAKTIPIDGKGTIEFDITDDLHIQPDEFKRSTTYALSVVVVEELTGMAMARNAIRFRSRTEFSVALMKIPF